MAAFFDEAKAQVIGWPLDIVAAFRQCFRGDFTSQATVGLPTYTLATLPTVVEGHTIYVSDATGASVTGSQCFGNASNWIDVTTGIAVV